MTRFCETKSKWSLERLFKTGDTIDMTARWAQHWRQHRHSKFKERRQAPLSATLLPFLTTPGFQEGGLGAARSATTTMRPFTNSMSGPGTKRRRSQLWRCPYLHAWPSLSLYGYTSACDAHSSLVFRLAFKIVSKVSSAHERCSLLFESHLNTKKHPKMYTLPLFLLSQVTILISNQTLKISYYLLGA